MVTAKLVYVYCPRNEGARAIFGKSHSDTFTGDLWARTLHVTRGSRRRERVRSSPRPCKKHPAMPLVDPQVDIVQFRVLSPNSPLFQNFTCLAWLLSIDGGPDRQKVDADDDVRGARGEKRVISLPTGTVKRKHEWGPGPERDPEIVSGIAQQVLGPSPTGPDFLRFIPSAPGSVSSYI